MIRWDRKERVTYMAIQYVTTIKLTQQLEIHVLFAGVCCTRLQRPIPIHLWTHQLQLAAPPPLCTASIFHQTVYRMVDYPWRFARLANKSTCPFNNFLRLASVLLWNNNYNHVLDDLDINYSCCTQNINLNFASMFTGKYIRYIHEQGLIRVASNLLMLCQ